MKSVRRKASRMNTLLSEIISVNPRFADLVIECSGFMTSQMCYRIMLYLEIRNSFLEGKRYTRIFIHSSFCGSVSFGISYILDRICSCWCYYSVVNSVGFKFIKLSLVSNLLAFLLCKTGKTGKLRCGFM